MSVVEKQMDIVAVVYSDHKYVYITLSVNDMNVGYHLTGLLQQRFNDYMRKAAATHKVINQELADYCKAHAPFKRELMRVDRLISRVNESEVFSIVETLKTEYLAKGYSLLNRDVGGTKVRNHGKSS